MKCQKCNGTGKIIHDWLPHETCHNCGGSGYVDMTNEEYLRSLNTEQLATFLGVVQYDGTGVLLTKKEQNARELQKAWKRFLRTQNEKEKTEKENKKAEEKD